MYCTRYNDVTKTPNRRPAEKGETVTTINVESFYLSNSVITFSFNKYKYLSRAITEQARDGIIDRVCKLIESKLCNFVVGRKFKTPRIRKSNSVPHNDPNTSEDPHLILFDGVSKESLNFGYDIDGISCSIYEYCADDIKLNIHLKFKADNLIKVTTKGAFCIRSCKYIRELINFKIGEIRSSFGRISVFFVHAKNDDDSNFDLNLFIKRIYRCLNMKLQTSDNINHYASSTILFDFFSSLFKLYPGGFLFLESYGNKDYYSSDSFNSVYASLAHVFSEKVIFSSTIDIGIVVRSSGENILFLTSESFSSLNLSPNFSLFFCNSMSNFNKRFQKISGNNVVNNYGSITKINFYSLIEDVFVNIRKIVFFPEISFNLVQNNFYGFRYKKKKLRDYDELFGKVFSRLDLESNIGYRLEVSTTGLFLPTVFNLLNTFIKRNNVFLTMNLNLFKEVVKNNITVFTTLMKDNSLEALSDNIVLETILKEFFIKGSMNKHFLPDVIYQKVFSFYNRKGIKKIRSSDVRNLFEENNLEIINKVLALSREFVPKTFIIILKAFICIHLSNERLSCVKLVVKQYMDDFKRFQKLNDSLLLNYGMIEDKRMIDLKFGSISLSFFLDNLFMHDFAKESNLAYYYMSHFLMKKLSISLNEFFDMVYSVFKRHGINLCFKLVKKGFPGKILSLLNLGSSRVNSVNKKQLLSRLREEVDIFLQDLRNTENAGVVIKTKGLPWTEDERIRLVHGLLRYVNFNSRWFLIKNDFIYGFYLSRTFKNALHDAFRHIVETCDMFELLKEAINWSPRSFPIEAHFRQFEVVIPEDHNIQVVYEDILNYDNTNYQEITISNLENFYNFHKSFPSRRKMSQEQFEVLKENITHKVRSDTYCIDNFINANYVPLDIVIHNDEYISSYTRPFSAHFSENVLSVEVDKHSGISLKKEKSDYIQITKKKFNEFITTINKLKEECEKLKNEFNEISDTFVQFLPDLNSNNTFDYNENELTSIKDTVSHDEKVLGIDKQAHIEENELNELKIKIKKKYKKTKFTAASSRNVLFTSQRRPSALEWNDILDFLCKEKFLIQTTHKKGDNIVKVVYYKVL